MIFEVIEALLISAADELLFNGGICPDGIRRMDMYELALKVAYTEDGLPKLGVRSKIRRYVYIENGLPKIGYSKPLFRK